MRWRHCTGCASQNVQSTVAILEISCRRRWPNWSASSAVSKYQPPGRAAHQLSTVGSSALPVAAAQVWNGLLEAVVSSSSLQTFRRQLKTHLFKLLIFDFWLFDWHHYCGPCSNVRNLGHSKIYVYCLLTAQSSDFWPLSAKPILWTILTVNMGNFASMNLWQILCQVFMP